jgi:uncharacterized protein
MPLILRNADLIWTPWKNGCGQMADVAVSPERTPSGDPVWRVSQARVERDGPFSHFPHVDRGMMLIAGQRLDLHIGEDPPLIVRAAGPAVTFAGDQPTRGVPIGGGIVNLNVMVERNAMRQRMIRWTVQGSAWLPVVPGGQTVILVQNGELRPSAGGDIVGAADMLVGDASLQITGQADLIEVNLWPA